MDFKQIEAYVKVIELASFSRAAEAIFLSQPSVSSYVSSLEKELEATLINRSTKELSPTLAGRIFYENVKELLVLKHNTVERIKNLAGNLSGEISILASTVPSQYILPRLIAVKRKGKCHSKIGVLRKRKCHGLNTESCSKRPPPALMKKLGSLRVVREPPQQQEPEVGLFERLNRYINLCNY